MTHDVFLSYSRKDAQLMHRVRDSLDGAGLSAVWTDEGIEPGTPLWDQAIEEAMHQARCMVVILTPNSKNAKGVRDEIHYANIHGKRVFPILAAGDIQTSVPYTLSGAQWVDARSNYETAMRQLVSAIQHHLSRPTAMPSASIGPSPKRERSSSGKRPAWLTALGSVLAVVLVSLLVLLWANGVFNQPAAPAPTLSENEKALTLVADTQVAVILNGFFTETSIANATATALAFTHTPTSTSTEDLTATANTQATLNAQAAANVPTDTPQPTLTPTLTPTVTPSTTITDTPDARATQTAETAQRATAQVNAQATLNNGRWTAQYYNNPNLVGSPALIQAEISPTHDWGTRSPGSAIVSDNFSARWTSVQTLNAGSYTLTVSADDGVRIYVDGVLLINAWYPSVGSIYSVNFALAAGQHTFVVEYYEAEGLAFLDFELTFADAANVTLSATATVTAFGLNVRNAPDRNNSAILVTIYLGETYPVLNSTAECTWYQINVNGTIGWVEARYVTIRGEADSENGCF